MKGLFLTRDILPSSIKIVVLILVMFSMSACLDFGASSHADEKEVMVFAAASLTESFTEIEKAYESEHDGVDIVINFAGSQILSSQIKAGAGQDIFFSANTKYPLELLVDMPEIHELNPELDIFAKNSLVIISATSDESDFDYWTEMMTTSDGKTVLADERVPVGKYTKSFTEAYCQYTGNSSVMDGFYSTVVSYESDVKSVVAKIAMQEADYGIVYATDTVNGDFTIIEIPDKYNQVAEYASIIFNEEPATLDFYDYVLKGQGKDILMSYGFTR